MIATLVSWAEVNGRRVGAESHRPGVAPLNPLYHPGETDEDDRTDERDDDRAYEPASRPNTKRSKKPASDDASEQPKDDVHQYSVS